MNTEAKKSVIEIGDDDDDETFFSLAAAAEAELLASKRRRITPPPATATAVDDKTDGLYMAALKGNNIVVRPSTTTVPVRARNDYVTGGGGGGGGGGDSCFKCGKAGHWARDCESGGGGGRFDHSGSGPADSSIAEKSCPCGLGICLVLTANTEKNRGRKFYKCPLRQENGGCGFFEWCDNSSGSNSMAGGTYGSDPSPYPGLDCPCGAGLCLILTAKTGNNIGQKFYRCPSNQGSSCGFFKWCNESTQPPRLPVTASKVVYNSTDTNNTNLNPKTGSSASSSSCFKCGKQGHWARDCPAPSSNLQSHLGERSASSGTCYKCGKPGHWSRDCALTEPRKSAAGNTRREEFW